MAVSLADLINQANALMSGQARQAEQVAGLQDQMAQRSSEVAASVQMASALEADAEYTKLLGRMETEQANKRAAQAYGTDVMDVGNIIVGIGDEMKVAAQRLIESGRAADELNKNSDIIGNPGGWLRGLLQGGKIRGERDAAAQDFQRLSQINQSLNAATQQTIQTQNALTVTLTDQSISAEMQARAIRANVEAAQHQMKAMQFSAGAIQTLMEQGSRNFSTFATIYNAAKQEEQWKAGFELRQLQFEEAQAARKERLSEQEFFAEQAELANLGAQSLGLPPVHVQNLKRHYGTNTPLGQELAVLTRRGYQIAAEGTPPPLGATPAQAVRVAQAINLAPPATHRKLVDVFEAVSGSDQIAQAARQNVPQEKLEQMFNEMVASTIGDKAKNVRQSDTSNPVAIPTINNMLEASNIPEVSAIKESPFNAEVLQPLLASGNDNPEAELIISTGLAAVDQGKLSMADLIQWGSTYFQAGVAVTAATGGFDLYGLDLPTTYIVPATRLRPGGSQGVSEGFAFRHSIKLDQLAADMEAREAQFSRAGITRLNLANPTEFATAVTLAQAYKLGGEAASILQTFSQNEDQ